MSSENFKIEDCKIHENEKCLIENLLGSRTFNYKIPRKPAKLKEQPNETEKHAENLQ